MMIAKFKYIRSPLLMVMYREISCQNCGIDDGTVCGCHSNQNKHGKGRGIKSSDKFCASMCSDCHFELDFGQSSRADKNALWDKAHIKTVAAMTDKFGDTYLRLIA